MLIDSSKLDHDVNLFLNKSAGAFTADTLIASLAYRFDSEEEAESFKSRVVRELDGNVELFKDMTKNEYQLKKNFFKNAEFCITPDKHEIEHGILFPGHRFSAFCSEDIFPSDVKFTGTDSKKKAPLKDVSEKLEDIIKYHVLLGSEQIFDFLIAENQSNMKLLQSKTAGGQVKLKAFDLKDFYRANDFEEGDAIAVKILDWTKGIFNFSYIPGNNRKASKVKQWIEKYSAAIDKTIDDYESYLEIPDQLSNAFFIGGRELLAADGASLDEFYRNNDHIEISIDNGHTILTRKSDTDAEEQLEVPEDVIISKGKTASIDEILAEIGIPMKTPEIDAYMLDQCYRKELEFVDFFSRCFGNEKLNFIDDAQENVFMNYIEDRWERFAERYNRHADELKAPVREKILETVEERLEWLQFLNSIDIAAAQLPQKEMKKLAEISLRLTTMLNMLNSDDYSIDEDEVESVLDAVEKLAETQTEIIARMGSFMNVENKQE
ncbi:MAG: hypothetical protein WCV67_05005 [Victivallaceae bacterium]